MYLRAIERLLLVAVLFAPGTKANAQAIGFPDLASSDAPPVTVSAQFTTAAADRPARLFVTATIADGWHVYSITQPPGGPVRTRIALEPGEQYKLAGEFKSIEAPEKHPEPAFAGIIVETHEGKVTWYAPLELASGVDAQQLKIPGKITLQACTEMNCLPPKTTRFEAALGSGVEIPKSAKNSSGYTSRSGHAELRGTIEPADAQAGRALRLVISVIPQDGFHTYPLGSAMPAGQVSKPTVVAITDVGGLKAGQATPAAEPTGHSGQAGALKRYYSGPAKWIVPLEVPKDATTGRHVIEGIIGFQTCSEYECDNPDAARFRAEVNVGQGEQGTVVFEPARYVESVKAATETGSSGAAAAVPAAFDPSAVVIADADSTQAVPVWQAMLWGFLGGFILNFMPCVLPVIGLKILSFVEQSGHDRRRIFLLNVWYTLGLLSVFMLLAALAVFVNLGWGDLNRHTGFNVALAGVVFAMGLSFLGVWEIPIPGFVGSGKANDLAAQEGFGGAFFKGIITTVLATPCSGPYLASALFWATAQPAYLVFALFLFVGLGMASPYLVIGAFPRLIRLLPRPGAWMDTFKQAMGFVLLATVVYILTYIPWPAVIPTVALLFSLWGACWWIGRTELTAELPAKARAWIGGLALVAVAWAILFPGLSQLSGGALPLGSLHEVMAGRFQWAVDRAIGEQMAARSGGASSQPEATHDENELPWKPFSPQALVDLTGEQRTVMVDFTADWCQTCKYLEKYVLNTAQTRKLVSENQVVTLLADWTNEAEDVTRMLETLGSKQVPLLAIFPAGRPNEPIVFRGPYTHQKLLDALEQAGPSKPQSVTKVTRVEP